MGSCSAHPPTLANACEALTSNELNECGEPAMNGLNKNSTELKLPGPPGCSGDSVAASAMGDVRYPPVSKDPWILFFRESIGEVAVVEYDGEALSHEKFDDGPSTIDCGAERV